MPPVTPEQIDDLLPQTQCGLCGYGGCMPYAEAIAFEKAALDLCPPGGVNTLLSLGNLLNQDTTSQVPAMAQKAKPLQMAVIREAECIGCTKCIQACPVDAILGSAKHMHTVITDECTGCELCIAPCPVDCIELQDAPTTLDKQKAQQFRQRFNNRTTRLAKEKAEKKLAQQPHSLVKRKNYIQEAIARAKAKKTNP